MDEGNYTDFQVNIKKRKMYKLVKNLNKFLIFPD